MDHDESLQGSVETEENDIKSESSESQGEETFDQQMGTNLDSATIDFLNEASATRCLKIGSTSDDSVEQLNTLDFVEYLGVDLALEPELAWICREMCCAPMPPNAEMLISKSGIVYFHDVENDYYTLEHPLTQRYLKVLEKSRLDILAGRSKPSISKLFFNQPDILFHRMFRNLQIPCQDCGIVQSVLRCEQCIQSYCQACFDNRHALCEGPKQFHKSSPTAVGSLCSSCGKKKPQVYCASCADYFCHPCFEGMHKKGYRQNHRAMMLSISDAEIVEHGRICEECCDATAAFHCDYCNDDFCIKCFWRCHLNGARRTHTVTKVSVTPLCSQCSRTRATVFCEQCQELLCTDCFTLVHYKGNRQLHLFMDASNLQLLLEMLDPSMLEHLTRARPKVLWAITQIQGWARGLEARLNYNNRKKFVLKIQRGWRGSMTRKKLLAMMDHFQWRKKQINNYFLPKTRYQRRVLKQKFHSQSNKQDLAIAVTQNSLAELRNTIVETSKADPLENPEGTAEQMAKGSAGLQNSVEKITNRGRGGHVAVAHVDKQELRDSRKTNLMYMRKLADELAQNETANSRFPDVDDSEVLRSRLEPGAQNGGKMNTLVRDPRKVREMTARDVLQIDPRFDAVEMEEQKIEWGLQLKKMNIFNTQEDEMKRVSVFRSGKSYRNMDTRSLN